MNSENQSYTYRDPRGTGSVRHITVTGERGNYRFFVDSEGNRGSLTLNMWEQFVTSGDIRPEFRPVNSGNVNGVSVWGIGPKADLFDRAVSLGYTMESAARVAEGIDAVSGTIDPCTVHPGMSTSIRNGYAVDSCEACDVIALSTDAGYVAETGQSGMDVLTDLLTIGPEPQPQAARVIKFHKLSAPMIGVIAEVARSRGLVGAWAMRHVIVKGVKGATMRTVTALISRGILADEINHGDRSGTGGLHDYVLTERGEEIAEVIGCPVVHLPTVPEVIATVVAAHDQGDCVTGCEVIIARGTVLLPTGGDVCLGCGSIFTRPSGQLHPSLDVISAAVVARNQSKGN